MVNFGRQGVLENVLLIDFSVGVGFATDNLERVDNDESRYSNNNNFNHGVINKTNGGLSLATSISLKIGGIF